MDKEEHFNESLFSSPLFSQDYLNSHHLSTLVAANHRLQHSTPETKQQEELMETLMKLPAIGLKLEISSSLLKKMQIRSTQSSKRKRINISTQTTTYHHNDCEKLKASILGAMMLQIGSWQLVARNEGDLVAKFYFAKKQLVWEILRNGLKEKIEIEWSNIIGIQAFMEENKPGILEVELHHPPQFYEEIEPEPRKHTQWTDGSDFTQGQASINRRHCIVFPPRVLDKHYEKLIDKDKHLFELSQRPFPTFNFLYFPLARSVVDYTPNFNETITQHQQQDQRMELLRSRYEVEANYYIEGKTMTNGYHDEDFSMGYWFAENNSEAALGGSNLSHHPSSSFDHNDTIMNMRAPQVLPSWANF